MTNIPFLQEPDVEYGVCETLSPMIRRITAPNPGPFTYTGTGVYIIGHGEVAVIDPGPFDPVHEASLDQALAGEHVSHVFVTHHHLDHSPLAHPLAAKHGSQVYGFGAQNALPAGGEVRLEAGDDVGFTPDIEISDGEEFTGPGWTIEALHTPGHTSNHVCYALKEENVLFSGDHVMAWSTSVISPPDGHMGDYLRELARVRDRHFTRLWPTHGPAVERPAEFVQAYIDHRMKREQQIVDALASKPQSVPELVATIYQHVDKRLHPAAAHSVLAHMIHLIETGHIESEGEPSLTNLYRLSAQD
ncbi:MBL fold metallo-hydrolase [Maricaulis salignorans]|uniref:Glyoxylase, beta-lactamase superfamily II n=1 Tax=Maricaulis salignorans TaxID=144026 RepID=A0A1G9Q9Q0_9PROT|nr:MBL fold metallo-hydrolase [Maricaulis salignorans]SDM07461.1 Glyoxylase, beta-lactamase superfamily II [Maricaulis salignorans]